MEKEESVRKQIDDMAWDHTKRYRLFQNLVGLSEPRPSLQSYLPILEAASIAGLPVDVHSRFLSQRFYPGFPWCIG
jgi:hypothetical protein